MSLKERVAEARSSARPGPACGVSKTLAVLDQEDGDALRHLIHQRLDLTGAEVSALLAEEGIEISQYVINRHRLGRCSTCKGR